MNRVTRVKIVLALVGIAVFGLGARLERRELRWVGIGAVAAAWLLRFAPGGEGRRPSDREPTT